MENSGQTITSLTAELRQLRQRVAGLEALQKGYDPWDFLRLFTEQAAPVILWVDAAAQIVFANDPACRLYGYSRLELTGKPYSQIHQEWNTAAWLQYWSDLRTRGNITLEKWHISRERHAFPVEIRATYLRHEEEEKECCIAFVQDISAQKSTEEQLRRCEALFQHIFHQSPIGSLVLDMSDAIASLNTLNTQGVVNVARYLQEHPEFLRQLASQIKRLDVNAEAQRLVQACCPDDAGTLNWLDRTQLISQMLVAIAEGQQQFEADVTSQTPQDEDEHWLIRVSFPEQVSGFDRVLVHVIDITDRKRAEEALRRSEERLRTLFENVTDLVFQATPNGRFLAANPQGVRRLGYQSAAELIEAINDIGSQIYVVPEDRQRVVVQLRETGRINGFEFQYYTRDREIRWGTLNAVGVRDEAGQLIRIDGFVQDTTERHRTLDELQRLQAELAHFGRVSTMGEMATGLAHELNQPLAGLKLYAQTCLDLLAGGAPAAELREPLKDIAAEAQRAAEIVLHLRQFVSRRLPCRATVDINQLVREVAKLTEYECRRSGIVVRLEMGAGLPPVVVDSIQIQQVLVNLIRNAVQALGDRSARRRSVAIRTAATEGDLVTVSVHDTGPGVPEELAARMFGPFVTTKPDGMGMGLAISQTIIARHGGRLWYTPAPSGGSVFQFTVPTLLAEESHGD